MAPSRTVLVIASYAPAAAWLRDCLQQGGFFVAIVDDTDAAFRLMMLIDIDAVVAWPAISKSTVEDVLDLTEQMEGVRSRVPVLVASFFAPFGLTPIDDWVRVPIAAAELRHKVQSLLGRGVGEAEALPTAHPPFPLGVHNENRLRDAG